MDAQMLQELAKPFLPSQVSWKPGAVKGDRALALAYGDLRAYMNRLDEVCAGDWSVEYMPWGADRIICKLTIAGVSRSSTGESTKESERTDIGGTVAEAQAFKRACATFGLGRYLYSLPSGWADIDPTTRRFTDKAKSKLTNLLVEHYRQATGSKPTGEEDEERKELREQFQKLGEELYADNWHKVSERNVRRITGGATTDSGELSCDQLQQLITGMHSLKSKRDGVAA